MPETTTSGDRFHGPRRLELNPEHVPKNDAGRRSRLAREDPRIRAFLMWSRFPFWMLEPVEGGTRVTVTDARFMSREAVLGID